MNFVKKIIKRSIGDRAFYRRLLAVMLPILLQNIITNFVSLLDNVMVGQVGTEQMSGVAIVNQLLFVYNLSIFGGLAGAGILGTQYYGKGDNKGVAETFRAKHYIMLSVTFIAFFVFIKFGDNLINLFIHDSNSGLDTAAAFNYGKNYLKIMLFGILPFGITQVYAGTLRETGETSVPMKAGIAAVFINLFFNYVLIFGHFGVPALGVEGAAIATVISRFAELLIVVVWTHTHKEKAKFIEYAYKSLKVPKNIVDAIIKMGMLLLVNEVLWSGGMTTLNQCYSVRGLEVVSAVNIAGTVINLFYCCCLSMGSTVSIIVGQLLGAGELERAVDENRRLTAFAFMMALGIACVMMIVAPAIPSIYNTTGVVKSTAAALIIIGAALIPADAITNCCYFALRSGGKTFITFLFDSAYVWVICIPFAFVLSRYTSMDIIPMYFWVHALDIIKAIFGIALIKSKKWVNKLV